MKHESSVKHGIKENKPLTNEQSQENVKFLLDTTERVDKDFHASNDSAIFMMAQTKTGETNEDGSPENLFQCAAVLRPDVFFQLMVKTFRAVCQDDSYTAAQFAKAAFGASSEFIVQHGGADYVIEALSAVLAENMSYAEFQKQKEKHEGKTGENSFHQESTKG